MYLTSVPVAGFSIGLYPDHSHHHVLCSHIYGWHSPHGHLVLLDKGRQKASLQWNLKKNGNTLSTEHEMFCLFSFSAVQNKTKENPSPGPSLPVYDPSVDCPSHQLYDLQPCPTICHVRKPEVSGAGEEMFSWVSLVRASERRSIDGAVFKPAGSNHFGPAECRQQDGLSGLVAGLLDSCPFWILSVSIRPCSYYCEGLLFACLPSV